jgi:hypothetical protein
MSGSFDRPECNNVIKTQAGTSLDASETTERRAAVRIYQAVGEPASTATPNIQFKSFAEKYAYFRGRYACQCSCGNAKNTNMCLGYCTPSCS